MDRPARVDRLSRWLRRGEVLLQTAAIPLMVLEHGGRKLEARLSQAAVIYAALTMAWLGISLLIRYRLSLTRSTFLRRWRTEIVLLVIWLLGLPFVGLMPFKSWSEFVLFIYSVSGAIRLLREISSGQINSAVVFVGSFAAIISTGMILLMLPISRPLAEDQSEQHADWLVALFTSTSACCVTGLAVVDTGTYWSRTGQCIIAGLIQVGGLGIMTVGAFFAAASSRGLQIRESAFLGSLFESKELLHVRRLVWSILAFTILSELIGGLLLATLPSDLPWSERLFFGFFHSISAFCNAGFGLYPANFEGYGHCWQVWGVVAGLIVIGGLGFGVLQEVSHRILDRLRLWRLADRRSVVTRLSINTRLVLITTTFLLIAGTVAVIGLEWTGQLRGGDPAHPEPALYRVANAWFQSVTFRTAGFNTIPQGTLHPATKLLAIIFMFIGASPGSTGGGIKTVTAALSFLAIWSLLRGRDRVDVWRRRVPDTQIQRGAMIVTLGLSVVFTATFLIVMIENKPAMFLDHLFEATSAFGTVGLSSIGTANLAPASQLVLVFTMFIGRVGMLTLIIALGGGETPLNYDYPRERVMLG